MLSLIFLLFRNKTYQGPCKRISFWLFALKCKRCFGEAINIGTGKPATINELANVLTEFFGQARVKPVYTAPKEGDIRNSCADIGKAEKMLGYKRKFTLRRGIRMLLKK